MEDEGHIADSVLDALYKALGLKGAHRSRHILKADRIEAHSLELLYHLNVLFNGVNGALGVAYAAGGYGAVRAVLLRGLKGGFDIAEVVQRVEDADDVDAVLYRELNELLDHVVVIVLVAQKVLAAQEHLEPRVRHSLADLAESLPRILAEIAEAGIEGGAAPALNGVVPGLVHGRQDLLEVLELHSCGHKRLVCVSQDRFGKLYFFHLSNSSL